MYTTMYFAVGLLQIGQRPSVLPGLSQAPSVDACGDGTWNLLRRNECIISNTPETVILTSSSADLVCTDCRKKKKNLQPTTTTGPDPVQALSLSLDAPISTASQRSWKREQHPCPGAIARPRLAVKSTFVEGALATGRPVRLEAVNLNSPGPGLFEPSAPASGHANKSRTQSADSGARRR